MEQVTWENENVRLAVTFIIGLVVGIGGYWLVVHRSSSESLAVMSNEQAASSTDSMQTTGSNGSNSLVVQNQAAGSSVIISSVSFTKPGWIAIHDNVNGQPGRILGAYLFDVGTHNGTVPLLRNTVNGKTYFAMLHSDDGDYHHFNVKTDTPLTDDSGKPIMVQFTASTNTTNSNSDTATTSVTSYINL